MKRIIKLFATLAFLTLAIVTLLCVGVSADDVAFTVTSKDGQVVEYIYEADLPDVFSSLEDGDVVTLKKTIKLNKGIEIISDSSDEPKEVYLDLCGKGLYRTVKSTVVSVSNYSTLNVYSSLPGGYMSVYDEANDSIGGCMFYVAGIDAKLNLGSVTVGDKTYPGSNLSTYSSAFIDVRKNGTAGALCDGGNHFANVADWAGFIGARNTEGEVVVKNANIVALGNNSIMHLEASEAGGGIPSLMLENCRIYRMESAGKKQLFNHLSGYVTIKDCVTNCTLTAENATISDGAVTLLGNNVFSSANLDTGLIKDYNGEILARVGAEYSFINGEKTLSCLSMYGKVQDLALVEADPAALVSPNEAETVVWKLGNEEIETLWKKGETPTPEYELGTDAVKGLYKNGWIASVREDGATVYEGGAILDFGIKVSLENDGNLFYHILVPAIIIDGGYLDFSKTIIDNASTSKDEWTRREIDGEQYYECITTYLDKKNPDASVGVSIVCKFTGNTETLSAKGVWEITLSEYVEKVLATENDSVYTTEEYSFVKAVKSKYLD